MTSIKSLDEQIAALERQLGDSDDSSDSSGAEESGTELSLCMASSLARLGRIDPLPTQLLPLPLCTKRKGDGDDAKEKPKKKKNKRAVQFSDGNTVGGARGAAAAPTASSSSSKSGLEKTIREMLSHYVPSSAERRPLWCRICRDQSADLAAFESHRESPEHKLAAGE